MTSSPSSPSAFASSTPTPLSFLSSLLNLIYTVFLEPLLCHLSLTVPGGRSGDGTYGRSSLPYSQVEKDLIYENPSVQVVNRKVPLLGEAMRKGGSWDKEGSSWVNYYTWQLRDVKDIGADIVLLHGLNDYSGKLAPHAFRFMQAGFRVIALDLPSFGRSTGLHAYCPTMRINVEATHAVIRDVAKHDGKEKLGRKLFLEGNSMGGFTALYYAAIYPPITPPEKDGSQEVPSDLNRPNLAGVVVCAPMITISPQSRPSYAVELFARLIIFFAGRLPLARAVRGHVSDDPRVDLDHDKDPQTYKGLLRIATGMAILSGIQELQALAPRINVPICIFHGSNDRATNPQGSKDFYERVSSKDKTLKIWQGYEHVMMKNVAGMDKADEEKRDAVLNAITQWFVDQVKKGN